MKKILYLFLIGIGFNLISGEKLVVDWVDKSGFPRIDIYFSLWDHQGKWISSEEFQKESLVVTEDEASQSIERVSKVSMYEEGGDQLNVLLLVDNSGSVQPYFDIIKASLERFVEGLKENDNVGMVTFANDITVAVEPTANKKKIIREISKLKSKGFSRLNDAIYEAIGMLHNCSGKKMILLVTDGIDDDGTGIQLSYHDFNSILNLAEKEQIPVSVIGVGSGVADEDLATLAYVSGGIFKFAPSGQKIDQMMEEVGLNMGLGKRVYYKTTYISTYPQNDSTVRDVIIQYNEGISRFQYDPPGFMDKFVDSYRY